VSLPARRGGRRRPRTALALACAALLLAALGPGADAAQAHGRSRSTSSWRLDGASARVQVRVPRVELTRLRPLGLTTTTGPAVSLYLAEHLRLVSADGPCAVTEPPRPRPAAEGWSTHAWALRCPSAEGLRIETDVLLDVVPSHLHFVRLRGPDGGVRERVLTEADPSWEVAASAAGPAGPGTSVAGYAWLGVEHIATGWDHLAFVLGLLLLATRVGEVARLVTGFTVAHSLTLALAVLGWVRPEGPAVEAVIAFSVALVGAENVWMRARPAPAVPWAVGAALLAGALLAAFDRSQVALAVWLGLALFSGCHFGLLARARRPERVRSVLAFVFGLVHGFGFAGILGELDLPTGRLAAGLLGFNLGVEAGQLAVVLLLWPVLVTLGRLGDGSARRRAADLGSAAVCSVGVYWLVSRAFS